MKLTTFTLLPSRSKQRGVALITAILVTTLAAIMAVSLISQQRLEIRRTGNVLESERAYVFALGVEGWVKHILDRDERKKDSLDEDWALNLPPILVEGAQLAGRIEDMQARFNLNNLVKAGKLSQPDYQVFQRLLSALGVTPDIANAVVDWIDEDVDPMSPGGGEDDDYSSLPQPYRAANRPMTSASELMLVKGVTPEIYLQLAPFVVALPGPHTPININTATAPVLAALVDGLSLNDAQSIATRRETKSFDSLQEFLQEGEIAKLKTERPRGENEPVDVQKKLDKNKQTQADGGAGTNSILAANMAGVTSKFFMLNAAVRFGDRGKADLYSLFWRDGHKVSVVLRSQGVY